MVDVIIKKSEELSGEVYAPPSKAFTHRALIASLLSSGTSKIFNPLSCDDTKATLKAIEAFGAKVDLQESCWTVRGATPLKIPKNPIDCGESGATLRFMIPVAALSPGPSTFTFGLSLRRRPLMPLLQSLKELGVKSSLRQVKESPYVMIYGGGIKGGKTSIRGDISSQFVSGLLFACPKAEEDTEIIVTTPLESKSYVQITMEVLAKHGIHLFPSNDFRQIRIPSNQKYDACNHEVPGDFSSAAFLLAAAAITSSKVKVKNLSKYTTQGDQAIMEILEQMGSKLKTNDDYVEVKGEKGNLNATNVDAKDIPDLVPVCAALACYSKGTFKIYNAKRLKYKESDRLCSLRNELKKMGADITPTQDGLIIRGPCKMHGTVVDPHNDHRIAMACAVAALGATDKTTIQNAECVKKSYPKFFEDLHHLGVDIVGW